MLTYPCARCGELTTLDLVDWIDSGTTLFCPQCGKATVVLLCKPGEYGDLVDRLKEEDESQA